jgi:purine-nucleoside phosphorylase
MSVVPEVITAVHAGMRTAALVVVTDMGLPDALEPIDVERVLATAAEAAPRLQQILRTVVVEG